MQDKQGYCTGTDCVGRIQGAALAVLALAENNIGMYLEALCTHQASFYCLHCCFVPQNVENSTAHPQRYGPVLWRGSGTDNKVTVQVVGCPYSTYS